MTTCLREDEKVVWEELLSGNPTICKFECLMRECNSSLGIQMLAYLEILKRRNEWTESTLDAVLSTKGDIHKDSDFNWEIWYEFGLAYCKSKLILIEKFPIQYQKRYVIDTWTYYRDKDLCISLISYSPNYKIIAMRVLKRDYLSDLTPSDIDTLLQSSDLTPAEKDFFLNYRQ